MAAGPHSLGNLSFPDRVRVVRAVKAGRAVSPGRLAPFAVELARRYQGVPERGSAAWLVSWTEGGSVGTIVFVLAVVLASSRWGVVGGVLAALAMVVVMIPLSRRARAARRRRAHEAEIANAKLFEERAPD
jgi:hypothetical protein